MVSKLSFDRLTDKERRMLSIGAACVAAVLLFSVLPAWWARWSQVRADIKKQQQMLDEASRGQYNPPGLALLVPAFDMPKDAETQKNLFRDKVNEQIRQAGLPSAPLQIEPSSKQMYDGYGRLTLKYKGACRFEQLLDFLARLKENKYYAGIDDLMIRADPKKVAQERQTVDVELTISTFVGRGGPVKKGVLAQEQKQEAKQTAAVSEQVR
jgi:hypothetical protein